MRAFSHLSLVPIWVAAACGGTQGDSCYREQWQGSCVLRSSTTIREADLPVPHADIEVIYTPQQNPRHPSFTPADVRQTFQVMLRDGPSFERYLLAHQTVPCRLAHQATTACTPGQVVLGLPSFNAAHYPVAAPPKVEGCAQIEGAGLDDSGLESTSEALPQAVYFERGASSPTPESQASLDELAAQLRSDSSIQCVGLVGRVSTGENRGLAERRAQAAKQALIERNVESLRLMTVAATQPVYGVGTDAPPVDPMDQRVNFTILLRGTNR